MNRLLLSGLVVAAAGVAAVVFTPGNQPQTVVQPGAAMVAVTMPGTLSDRAVLGRNAFNGVCADCHGENAAGRQEMGPPLIHKIYEPSHHGDMAFVLAVQNGVRQHHWPFGDMPAQNGLTQGDVANIVAFVREVQRANGIE